jgi:hypothetical protein
LPSSSITQTGPAMSSPYDGPLLALPFAGTTAPGNARSRRGRGCRPMAYRPGGSDDCNPTFIRLMRTPALLILVQPCGVDGRGLSSGDGVGADLLGGKEGARALAGTGNRSYSGTSHCGWWLPQERRAWRRRRIRHRGSGELASQSTIRRATEPETGCGTGVRGAPPACRINHAEAIHESAVCGKGRVLA